MTKSTKIKLDEFLSREDSLEKEEESNFVSNSITRIDFLKQRKGYSGISIDKMLVHFIAHGNFFKINGDLYENIVYSNSDNIYFYTLTSDNEILNDFILLFDPIIDIKLKNNDYYIFYYPEKLISISLIDKKDYQTWEENQET